MLALYGSLILSIFAGGVVVWGWLIWRLAMRLPILPHGVRRDVPWGLGDLLLAVGMYLFFLIAAAALMPAKRAPANPEKADASAALAEIESPPKLTLESSRQLILIDTVVKLIVAALITTVITLRYRPTADDWGWSVKHLYDDVRTGATTFLAIYGPMIGLQVFLVAVLQWKYEHPFIELVTESKDPLLFALAGLAATITAPLFEEFVFRGLLQGWLEKLFARNATYEMIVQGGRHEPEVEVFAPLVSEKQPPLDPNPYASPTAPRLEPAFQFRLGKSYTFPTSRDWLAIVVSMLVFSLLHYSHGPAWIPLLIFGAATGLVYQRTHRLWPGIVAHFLLNATTMLGLWVQVFGK